MRPYMMTGLGAFIAFAVGFAQLARGQDPQATAVIFEDVRIFNGTSDRLSGSGAGQSHRDALQGPHPRSS